MLYVPFCITVLPSLDKDIILSYLKHKVKSVFNEQDNGSSGLK